ncbi:hypothetical protein E4U11_002790 [Claviceps purpurea]|nr:hypothetical protein E4U11_002790 [Claviceps purpurea]
MTFRKNDEQNESRMPSLHLLRKMLLWAGDGGARKIVIPTCMRITQRKLTLLLKASPRLEHLNIDQLRRDLTLPVNGKIFERLRYVSIAGFFHLTPIGFPGGFPQMFLQNSASTLEHLDFDSIPREWSYSVPSIPLLPKLKILRMRGSMDDGTPLPIYALSIAFPRLEQLSIASVSNLHPEPVAIWRKEWENIWPHLKVLMFQSNEPRGPGSYETRTYSTLRYLTGLNCGNSLEHIRFEFGFKPQPLRLIDIFGGSHDTVSSSDVFQHAQFQNLRSLRSETMWISPDRARALLSNAIKNKKLTSFEIVFPNRDYYEGPNVAADASVRHLKGYDWLRGTSTIHTLGCQNFFFSSDREHELNMLLPQFLATFPNLRTLSISSMYYDIERSKFAKVILEILKATHLQTIYTRTLGDVKLGWLDEAARSKGTEIILESEPPIWPIPLEQ